MRKLRELVRLKHETDLSVRQIARSLNVSRRTVNEYEQRFAESGLTWPLPQISDTELERKLYPPPPVIPSSERPVPDGSSVHPERRRAGVTRLLLWQESQADYPAGFQYSGFCQQ